MRQRFESVADAAQQGRSALDGERAGSRRGFLGWMGRIGATVVGGLAGVTALGEEALAAPNCCHLATSVNCDGSGPDYRCPAGYQKQVWYCTSGGRTLGCGECTTGRNCRSGNYACSESWVQSTSAA